MTTLPAASPREAGLGHLLRRLPDEVRQVPGLGVVGDLLELRAGEAGAEGGDTGTPLPRTSSATDSVNAVTKALDAGVGRHLRRREEADDRGHVEDPAVPALEQRAAAPPG